MSKPFVVQTLVEDLITMRTTDSSAQVILDQNAPGPDNNWIVIKTDRFDHNIQMTTDVGEEVKIGGGNIFLTTPNGNVSAVAGQIILNGQQVRQTMLTLTNEGVLSPANALYNELNNGDIGGLNEISRVNIDPDVAGTVVNSLIIHTGDPNIDGRIIVLQNIGTAPGQTLTLNNLSGAGTAGGLFVTGATPVVLAAGHGCVLEFSASTTADGAWLVSGVT